MVEDERGASRQGNCLEDYITVSTTTLSLF